MATFHNLLRNVAVVQRATQVTGSTAASNLPGIDMLGYTGISWIVLPAGTPTTGFSFKAQECSSSGFSTGSDVADLTGTDVPFSTAIVDGFAGIDIFRPAKRWVRAVLVKTSTADLIDGAIGIVYNALEAAVTHSTAKNYGVEYFVTPATGTA